MLMMLIDVNPNLVTSDSTGKAKDLQLKYSWRITEHSTVLSKFHVSLLFMPTIEPKRRIVVEQGSTEKCIRTSLASPLNNCFN